MPIQTSNSRKANEDSKENMFLVQQCLGNRNKKGNNLSREKYIKYIEKM